MVYQLESPDINTVINYCKDLCANDKIEVYDFGGKKDLVLHIYKDEDFDQKTKAYNLVTISTFRNGKAVDDTGDIHVSELDAELERSIFIKKRIYLMDKKSEEYLRQYIKLTDTIKQKIEAHAARYHIKAEICAWYSDWEDFCSDWCDICGYSRTEARRLYHGGIGEFMRLPEGNGIVRFAI